MVGELLLVFPGETEQKSNTPCLAAVSMVIAVSFSVGILVLALLQRGRRREKALAWADPNEGYILMVNAFLREEN